MRFAIFRKSQYLTPTKQVDGFMDKYSKDVLRNFKPAKKFFAGVDSDGCVFDTMGIKQRECFCPWMIGYFGLQPVAQAARECKEFADLFSKTRGANRHKTIKLILSELLPSHPMVKTRGFTVPQYPHYFAWVDAPDSLLSNEGLKRAAGSATNPDANSRCSFLVPISCPAIIAVYFAISCSPHSL